jgi:hypothetical protein
VQAGRVRLINQKKAGNQTFRKGQSRQAGRPLSAGRQQRREEQAGMHGSAGLQAGRSGHAGKTGPITRQAGHGRQAGLQGRESSQERRQGRAIR